MLPVVRLRCSVNQHDPNSVRRLSRDDAAKLAVSLTRDLLASTDLKGWIPTLLDASPCSIDPRPVGKTPSRWIVGVDWARDDSPDSVFDGASMVIADLTSGSAEWAE